MNKSLFALAALAALSFGAHAQGYWAQRDSQAQAQQQYQAPQPGSEHYNPELDPRNPQYNPNNVPPGHAYSNDPQRSQYPQGYVVPDTRWSGSYGYAPDLRDQRRWVRDWRARRLDRPPQGYHWVRGDRNEYLLVQDDTGRVARVIAGR